MDELICADTDFHKLDLQVDQLSIANGMMNAFRYDKENI